MTDRPRRIRRFAAWGKPSRLTAFVDLAFKGAALVAALVAASFFQQPNIVILKQKNQNFGLQAFVDVPKLEENYRLAGKVLPNVVRQTARLYDDQNQKDLVTKENPRQYSAEALCGTMRVTVEELFPEANCNADVPYLGGRGRSYEGLLLKQNGTLQAPLSTDALREALVRLRDAEYLVARYLVKNVGFAYATEVRVLPPEQFRPSPLGSFSLAPGESYAVRFESDRGTIETSPSPEQLETSVSWDKGAGVITHGWFIVLQVLVAILLGLLAWAVFAELQESP